MNPAPDAGATPVRESILVAVLLLLILAGLSTTSRAEVRQITWDDLLPDGWIPPSVSVDHFFDATPAQPIKGMAAPVVAAMDGLLVKLPGYLVPITLEGESLREFLMVPYFGACIHVPPPPPNQVVFVRLDEPVTLDDPYGPHWVTGVIRTTLSDTELAEAAYTMSGEKVEVFDWDAMFPDQASSDDGD
jgi:hypothetical protein